MPSNRSGARGGSPLYRLAGRPETRTFVSRHEVAKRLEPISPLMKSHNEEQGPMLIDKRVLEARLRQVLELLGNRPQPLDVLNEAIYDSFAPPIEEPHVSHDGDAMNDLPHSDIAQAPFAARLPVIADRIARSLSERQRRVLSALSDEERTGAAVARELRVSAQTVSNDRQSAMDVIREQVGAEDLDDNERKTVVGFLLEILAVDRDDSGEKHDP
jgi:hypothetical protein